jgi:hypothetical protein
MDLADPARADNAESHAFLRLRAAISPKSLRAKKRIYVPS